MTGPLTTEDVQDLLATLEQSQANLRAMDRRLRAHGDAIALTTRPTYPTSEQALGIEEAARRIRAAVVPAAGHHGDPCGPEGAPYVVAVDGAGGWLNVRAGAPYSLNRTGGRLWDFTDEEVEAIFVLVRAQGLVIGHQWRGDNSLSIRIVRPEEVRRG